MQLFVGYFSPPAVGLGQSYVGLGFYLTSASNIPNNVIVDLNGIPVVDLNGEYIIEG